MSAIRHRAVTAVLLFFGITALPHATAKDKSKTTILRDRQYVCVLGKKGEKLQFTINCRRHSDVPTGVSFTVIEPDSEVLGRGRVPLFQKKQFSYTLRKDGMHVIALKCKGNTYDIAVEKAPTAHLATKQDKFHLCAGCRKLYFFVPKSVASFSLFLHAGTVKEGARVTVYDAEGKIAHKEEGDYNKPTEIKIRVPDGTDDRTWSVTFEDAEEEKFHLDDVLVHFSPNINPFLAERKEWAPLFGGK